MTKRNLTLGTASGKLGSTVYYRRRGQQISRVLVSSINDKRTLAQRLQRARFANYVAGWRLVRQYVERSWRGVSRYGSPENAFYHHNRGFMPTASKGMSRAGYAFPPLGIVTYGSLQVGFSLRGVGVNSSVPPTGLSAVSVELEGVSSAPQNTVFLAGAFVSADVGVQATDIVHILAWAYAISSTSTSIVSASEYSSPQVYHLAVSASGAYKPLSDAAPWLEVSAGTMPNGRTAIGFDIASAYLPSEPPNGFVDYVFALYIERPSNPQHSRYSRARFVAHEDTTATLRSLCDDTGLSQTIANTYLL